MNFKHERDKMLFHEVHVVLQLIFADMNLYSFLNFNKQLVITDTVSTLSEDKRLGRVSSSHRQKRAIDISVKGISDKQVSELLDFINYKPEYREYHYLSNGGAYRLAYRHDSNNGDHIHLAIHSRFAIK